MKRDFVTFITLNDGQLTLPKDCIVLLDKNVVFYQIPLTETLRKAEMTFEMAHFLGGQLGVTIPKGIIQEDIKVKTAIVKEQKKAETPPSVPVKKTKKVAKKTTKKKK